MVSRSLLFTVAFFNTTLYVASSKNKINNISPTLCSIGLLQRIWQTILHPYGANAFVITIIHFFGLNAANISSNSTRHCRFIRYALRNTHNTDTTTSINTTIYTINKARRFLLPAKATERSRTNTNISSTIIKIWKCLEGRLYVETPTEQDIIEFQLNDYYSLYGWKYLIGKYTLEK